MVLKLWIPHIWTLMAMDIVQQMVIVMMTMPDVNPGAEETPGDGVDSNCDGEDDT